MNPQGNPESSTSGAGTSVTTIEDFGPGKTGQASRWKAELDSAKRADATFVKRAEKTVKRYRDERDSIDDQDKKFNILWSNVETLKPAIYAKPPVPEVSRRFDTTSQVNRVAALIMERNLHYTVCEHSMFDATLKACVEDRLLPGRGVAWVRYVASMKPMYAGRPTPLPPVPPPSPPMPGPPGAPAALPQPAPAGPPGGPPGMVPQPSAGLPPPAGVSEPPPAGVPPTQPPIEALPPGPLPMLGAPQPTPPLTPPQPKELQNKAITSDAYESQVISGEQICYDYVHWKDFRHSPARTWDEVCWVARRVYMTREVGTKRFGTEFAKVPLNYTEPKAGIGHAQTGGNEAFGPGKGVLKKAAVWEIWSKDDLKVYWLCEDHPEILDERPDLFQLDDFFPCPCPVLATTTNDSLVPIPDFCMYQDQASELDQITNRISLLTQALKVIGVYDKTQEAVQRLLTEGTDNTMIPVDNWAMFAERGGLKGVVDFFPVEMVMNVLERLINARGVIKQDVYEITGIADIVRGASVASETATAQTIKEKFANIRIHDVQTDIARFASDLINMSAQLMTNFFQPETLLINADLADPTGPDFVHVPQAVQLVKDGKLIQHKISVSVDAITQQDDKEEKEARNEFMQNFGFLLQQIVPASETMPELKEMFAHIMMWSVRGFKVGRDIEGTIEQNLAKLAKEGPPPPKPDPAMLKAQTEQQSAQMEMQLKQQDAATKAQADQNKMALEQQQTEQELAFKEKEHELDLSFKEREFQLKLEFMREEYKLKAQQAESDMALKAQTAEVDGMVKRDAAQQDAALKLSMHEQDSARAQETHEMTMEQQAAAAAQKQAADAAAAKAKGPTNAK